MVRAPSYVGVCSMGAFLCATGCTRTSEDGPAAPASAPPPAVVRVGNQVPGVETQPDFDGSARALRDRIAPHVDAAHPSDATQACRAMLDAVASHYAKRDTRGVDAVRHVASVRSQEEAACASETSAEAVACVTWLLEEEPETEFPWALDQCSRAYPRTDPTPSTTVAPSREPLRLAFVGDVIFGRYREAGYDPIPEGDFAVFEEVAPLLAADVLVGNLETPLVRALPERSPIGARFQFGASFEHARALRDAGFTAMSLANNHWFDLREEGVAETPILLQELGIAAFGGATLEPPHVRVETLARKGWSLAFIAITARTNAPLREGLPKAPYLPTDEIVDTVRPLLEDAGANHDARVVLVHWGDEYVDVPTPAQIQAAHGLVDAGADLVIGHHPHVLQGIETYGDGIIAYSLGNFLFENTHEIPRLTGVLHVELDAERCLQDARFRPAYIKRYPVQRPVPAKGGMARRIHARIKETSAGFATSWEEDGDDLRIQVPACPSSGATPTTTEVDSSGAPAR